MHSKINDTHIPLYTPVMQPSVPPTVLIRKQTKLRGERKEIKKGGNEGGDLGEGKGTGNVLISCNINFEFVIYLKTCN